MRFTTRILLSLISLAATFASAQTILAGTFKHIIIVVQENSTPDNIFGANPSTVKCGSEDPFEPGVDIENGGYVCTKVVNGQCQAQQIICNVSQPMNNGPKFDPGHYYGD